VTDYNYSLITNSLGDGGEWPIEVKEGLNFSLTFPIGLFQ